MQHDDIKSFKNHFYNIIPRKSFKNLNQFSLIILKVLIESSKGGNFEKGQLPGKYNPKKSQIRSEGSITENDQSVSHGNRNTKIQNNAIRIFVRKILRETIQTERRK